MNKDFLIQAYQWYYSPGETIRSIGFYVNPYKKWKDTKYRHVFAFDAGCNLYVGQYSVYPEHLIDMFELDDRREYGFLYPQCASMKPKYSETEIEESGIKSDKPVLWDQSDVIIFEFMEHQNITYLNIRLKKMVQRLYDYGMPANTIVHSTQIDLWNPTIGSILKDKLMIRRSPEWFREQLAQLAK